MADIARFVQELRLAGIRLSLEGDEIRVRGTQALDDATRAELRARRVEVLDHLRRAAGPVPRPTQYRTEAPLSFAQRRLWFLERWNGPSALYNEAAALRIEGALDDLALAAAIGRVIARHEILRTTYHDRDGVPFQRIHPAGPFDLERVDLTAVGAQTPASLEAALRQRAERPFDLAEGPMVRATLFRTGAAEHYLCLVMHHIACDGWSSGILISDLSAAYLAQVTGQADGLADLPIQYADYAVWQSAPERRADEAADLAYWQDRLAGAPERISLPADMPRSGDDDMAGATVDFTLPPTVATLVADLALAHRATPYMVLLTAFYALLARLGGDEDIVLGGAIANRDRLEIEPLVGFFVNTLALRVDLSGAPTFRQALQRVTEVAHGAFAHQGLPFDQLITHTVAERARAHAPLFQVMFSLQNAPTQAMNLAGLRVTRLPLGCRHSKFDLTLFLRPDSAGHDRAGYTGTFEFRTALFRPRTVARMGSLYRRLLEEALAAPDVALAQLSLLDAGDEAAVLAAGTGPATSYPRDRSIPDLFSQIASAMPGAVAVSEGGTTLDYKTLWHQATCLAGGLQAAGIRPGDRVALGLGRTIPMVVATLGTLLAGAVYVPLDPDHPPERTAALIGHSGARAVIGLAGASSAQTLDYAELLRSAPARMTGLPGDPLQPAYVMYTSGSTGRPKGVVVPHRAIVRLVLGQDYAAFGPGKRFAGVSNPAFDAATFELWGALLTGGELHLIDHATLLSPTRFAQSLQHRRIDTLFLTTALFNRIAEECPTAFGGLHSLLVGGEALSAAHVRMVLRSGSAPRRLANCYGPTECTTFAACLTLRDGDCDTPRLPLGGPLANTSVFVLDDALRPCAIGVPGEIFIGGDGLALGYHDDPALTDARFIADPLGAGRLFRTGDLARLRDDGRLDLFGRSDDMVKLRGFRIEPQEVADVLQSHPSVAAAQVLPWQDAAGTSRLVAYVVPHLPKTSDAVLTDWTELFDTTYTPPETSSPGLDHHFDGWISSATDAPIPLADMQDWLDGTLAELRGPKGRSILEIGAGTGLLLADLAPDASVYVATDISGVALDRLARRRAAEPGLSHVRLMHCPAHDLSGLGAQRFDLIILNSVVQYFPDARYLLQVLSGLMPHLAEGGRIHLGDLRNLDLLTEFHTWVARHRMGEGAHPKAVQDQVQAAIVDEAELVLSPDLFRRIDSLVPGLACRRVSLKRGASRTEMTLFRYSAELQAAPQARSRTLPPPVWQDWRDSQPDLTGLEMLLHRMGGELALSDIPNSRIHDAIGSTGPALDPDALYRLADRLGLALHLTFARDAKAMDALFTRSETALAQGRFAPAPAGFAQVTNHPALARMGRPLRAALRGHARHLLPAHMVPSAIVLLAQFPLTSNGKIARAFLPAPGPVDMAMTDGALHRPPATETENRIHAIWAEVLGTAAFGVDDGFFDLGGHSLLATQVVSRLKDRFGDAPSLRRFFDAPTISALAAFYSAELTGHDLETVVI